MFQADENMNVYPSYELIYYRLEGNLKQEAMDAVELLKSFSFPRCEHIQTQFLLNAVHHAILESNEAEKLE